MAGAAMYYRLKGEMPARAVVARIAAVIVTVFSLSIFSVRARVAVLLELKCIRMCKTIGHQLLPRPPPPLLPTSTVMVVFKPVLSSQELGNGIAAGGWASFELPEQQCIRKQL